MRRQLLKDSAVYIGGSVIVQILGFTGLIFLMQFLPVSEYGKYIYIIEFISIFAFFSDAVLASFLPLCQASLKLSSQKVFFFFEFGFMETLSPLDKI
jgi:hypothetical protein